MEHRLRDILLFSVFWDLCVRLGVIESQALNLRSHLDARGNSDGDEDTICVFLPISAFMPDFRNHFLRDADEVTAARRSLSGLFLHILGTGNCAPPRNAPRIVLPPVNEAVETQHDVEEEAVGEQPPMSWMVPLFGMVSYETFQQFGWCSTAEYAAWVSNPSNIVLFIRNNQVESVLHPEYEHVSVPFSAIPEGIRNDIRAHGAFFDDEDTFQVNIVRAERSG